MIVDRVNRLFKPIRAFTLLFSGRCAFKLTATDFAIGYIRIHRPELDIFGVTRRNQWPVFVIHRQHLPGPMKFHFE